MSRDRSNHSEDTGSDSVDSPCVNSDSVDSQRRAPAGSASALAPDPDQSRPHTTTVVSNWLPQVEHAEADHDIVEEPLAHGFSCPYHKRNPKRFNEHDYPYCATDSYEDMTDLAWHIQSDHARHRFCPRCCRDFRTEDAFRTHIRSQTPCELSYKPFDPEDGINSAVEKELEDRKREGVLDWEELWAMLFPDQPAFVPPEGRRADMEGDDTDREDKDTDRKD